jgi:adenylate cyclase class 2
MLGKGESIPNEIEVKLSMPSVAAARKKIAKLGAKLVRREVGGKDGRVHEVNILFDTPDGGFARHGQLLRVRIESAGGAKPKGPTRAVLTYKGPGEPQKQARFKIRDEREVVVADDAAMRGILEALGLRGWFRYEKYRTTFALPGSAHWAAGLKVELDETPIGIFVELEGPPAAIDRAAKELGFSRHQYVMKNYLLPPHRCGGCATCTGCRLGNTRHGIHVEIEVEKIASAHASEPIASLRIRPQLF